MSWWLRGEKKDHPNGGFPSCFKLSDRKNRLIPSESRVVVIGYSTTSTVHLLSSVDSFGPRLQLKHNFYPLVSILRISVALKVVMNATFSSVSHAKKRKERKMKGESKQVLDFRNQFYTVCAKKGCQY